MNANPALQSSRLRRFRLLAVLLAITPFLLLEITVRLLGWGLPRESYDPYLGFKSVHPLFVVNDSQDRYQVAESRLDFFQPDHFPTSKESSTYRIFCLGGSTVQGRPYALETAFSSWLELSLQSAAPQRSWEVINCGGISYASYRLVPILEEILNYEPDLVILYTGHNEFLEDRTYPHFKDPSLARQALYHAQSSWRTINWLRQHFYPSPLPNDPGAAPIVMPTEVNGLLDQARLQDYHRDASWHQDVVQHYEFNLQRMIQLTAKAHVPLLLVNPVSNLKDCPPFKIEPSSNLGQVDRQRVEQLQHDAHSAKSLALRLEKLEAAVALDPLHAGIQYQLGKCYEDLEQFKKARQSFLAAKDQDVCPLRMLESMHAVLLRTASETDTPLIDARKLLENRSSEGIPGKKVLLDHVHPTIEAHQWIAQALLETMCELKILTTRRDWQAARTQRYREHLAGLSEVYYARGKQRLAGLRLWTQGRAKPRSAAP